MATYTHQETTTSPDSIDKWQIESIVRSAYQAINGRNLDPEAEVWQNFSPDYADDCAGVPYEAREYVAKQYAGDMDELSSVHLRDTKQTTNIRAFLEVEKRLSACCPEYSYLVLDDMTIEVMRKAKFASAWANVESYGLPPGVVRRNVVLMEFEKNGQGKWLCVRSKNVPGLQQNH